MRRQAIIAALLIIAVGVVLGATVFRADIAQAMGFARYDDGCITGSLRSKVIRFRATDGMPLHGVLLGSGRKGIVLSHAFPGNLCDWFPFVPQLAARGYRVLAYDSRPTSIAGGARRHARNRRRRLRWRHRRDDRRRSHSTVDARRRRDALLAQAGRRDGRRGRCAAGEGTVVLRRRQPFPARGRGPEALCGVGLEAEAARGHPVVGLRHAAARLGVGACVVSNEAAGVHRLRLPALRAWQ